MKAIMITLFVEIIWELYVAFFDVLQIIFSKNLPLGGFINQIYFDPEIIIIYYASSVSIIVITALVAYIMDLKKNKKTLLNQN